VKLAFAKNGSLRPCVTTSEILDQEIGNVRRDIAWAFEDKAICRIYLER